jgi:polyisoprenoid-binding protein YceI
MKRKSALIVWSAGTISLSAHAAHTYTIDPNHTYPSFEVDHMGLSLWRGKFNHSHGSVTLDRRAKSGMIDITIDIDSIDFGHDQLNEHVKSAEALDVDRFPTARYQGTSIRFDGDRPVAIDGFLTLHGITKPVTLTIRKFTCIQHPVLRREVCGADAAATFNRTDFGVSFGIPRYSPQVKLSIQVEAIKN